MKRSETSSLVRHADCALDFVQLEIWIAGVDGIE